MGNIPMFIARGLNDEGRARASDISDAVAQCRASGAKIISLSLSGDQMSDPMKEEVDAFYNSGGLMIAAAGNQGIYREAMPASYPAVISVAAVDETGEHWSASNNATTVELAAPGVRITSTAINSRGNLVYANYSGTSMAVPHVAAAAALIWSHHPECTNVQIRYALAYTAENVGPRGCDAFTGYGVIQTKDALNFLDRHGCVGAIWGQTSSSNGKCSTIDAFPAQPWWRGWWTSIRSNWNNSWLSWRSG